MKTFLRAVCIASVFAGVFAASPFASAQQSCESLASLKIANVTVTMATAISAPPDWNVPSTPGRFGTPPGLKVSVPFCRVAGSATPTSDSHIGFEVWLPVAANWNGNYIGIGNPGFIGAVSYGGLVREIAKGSVAASTDTGHNDVGATSEAPDAWAVGHPEKITDWGHRAVHETTVAAKALLLAYYGKPAKLSFWSSCHEGGNQALTEAQKYPLDFDGIAAGDPAYYITHLQSASEWFGWISLKDGGVKGAAYIPPAKYAVIHRAVLDQCDMIDGVRDGVLENPLQCHFNPETIRCPGKTDNASCLTGPQAETAKHMYEGPRTADGKSIYPGFDPGSELGWSIMAAGPDPISISTGFFKAVVYGDLNWDYHTFDVERDARKAAEEYGAALDSNDPNLKAFKDHGGKLLLYNSWDEAAVLPRASVEYYDSVNATMGGVEKTKDFFRLFMVPGMGMCPGFGFGNDGTFDAMDVVQKWRVTGVAPDRIVNSHKTAGAVDKTHPACAWPQQANYKGSGDPMDAANFTCGVAKK
jgi:feruloyl esterase